jgi:hypothetical protein
MGRMNMGPMTKRTIRTSNNSGRLPLWRVSRVAMLIRARLNAG